MTAASPCTPSYEVTTHACCAAAARGGGPAVADLTRSEQVLPVLEDCTRGHFGMSVLPSCLEATLVMASAVRARSDFELLARSLSKSKPRDRSDNVSVERLW